VTDAASVSGAREVDGRAGGAEGQPVGREEDGVDLVLAELELQVAQVQVIIAVAAVLVLNLHRDYGAACVRACVASLCQVARKRPRSRTRTRTTAHARTHTRTTANAQTRRRTARILVGREHGKELVEEAVHTLQVPGIRAPQLQALFVQKPRREAAKLELWAQHQRIEALNQLVHTIRH
jgi:hypothetical protein